MGRKVVPKLVEVSCSKCSGKAMLSRQKGLKWSRNGGWVCRSCIIRDIHARGLIKQPKKPITVDLVCTSCNDVYTVNRRYSISKRKTSTLCHRCSMRLDSTRSKMSEGHSRFKEHNPERLEEIKKLASARSVKLWETRRDEMLLKLSESRDNPETRRKMREWYDSNRFKDVIAKRLVESSRKESSLQKSLYVILEGLGVPYKKEGVDTTVGFYVFDCLVEHGSKKFLIECQGEYWHSSPEAKRRDQAKFTYMDRYFPEYTLIYLWEYEFYCKGRVEGRLKSLLGVDSPIIDFKFNNCILKTPTVDELKVFLSAYHYLGKGRGGKVIGAYLGEILIAACVFSPPIRQNITFSFGSFVELSRLCIHPRYQKKNFASWFVSRCVNIIGENVVAYADTTVGHRGTVYRASNFKLHHETKSDYWYSSSTGHIMHKKTAYNHAKKLGKTESEYATDNGLDKRWGGKKLCYIFERKSYAIRKPIRIQDKGSSTSSP